MRDDLDGRIDAIITGRPSRVGDRIHSAGSDEPGPLILRPGLVTPEEIQDALRFPVAYDPAILSAPEPGVAPRAPGMKYRHYAPRAEMILFKGPPEAVVRTIEDRRLQAEAAGKKVGTLLYGQAEKHLVARDFFSRLRQMDETGAD